MKLLTITKIMLAGFALSVAPALERGTFGPFMRSLNNTPHGYQIVNDPTGTWTTTTVERFEVRPGDCASNSGWNDCEKDRERSELSEQIKGTNNGTQWYGWSIYFPKDYINIYPTKVSFSQFHQDKSHPVWMFQNSGGYFLDDQVYGFTRQHHLLIAEEKLRDKWHKIEINVNWTKKSHGFFKVWVNGEQKVDYAGQTKSAENVYFKYGIYRSFLSRYRNAKGVKDVPAQTVLFANVRRSNKREGLSVSSKK